MVLGKVDPSSKGMYVARNGPAKSDAFSLQSRHICIFCMEVHAPLPGVSLQPFTYLEDIYVKECDHYIPYDNWH